MKKIFKNVCLIGLGTLAGCNLFTAVDPLPPSVSEVVVESVSTTFAVVSGKIAEIETSNSRQRKKSGKIIEYGFVYGITDNPTLESAFVKKISEPIAVTPYEWSEEIASLTINTTYYIRTYAINEGGGVAYSPVANFTTGKYTLPTLATVNVSNVTKTSADVNYNILTVGNAAIVNYGVCYSNTNQTPTINDLKVQVSGSAKVGNYVASLSNLSLSTIYYARGYVTTAAGAVFGNVISFTSGEQAVYTPKKSFVMNWSNPYDLDLGMLVSQDGSEDLSWYPYNGLAGIYPKNGAKFSVLGILKFDDVKYSDLINLPKDKELNTNFINGSYADVNANKLPNGTVVAYITNQGRYGKMVIDSHGQERTVSDGGNMQVTMLTYAK